MMSAEQEIEILKSQVAQLFGMLTSAKDAEVAVPRCGPVIDNDVLSSDEPVTRKVISFSCSNVGLVITIKLGNYYFKGVPKTIGSWPAQSAVTIAATTYGYVSISLIDGAATWMTAASDPGSGDDDTEIWPIFVATVSGGKITELHECLHSDIHCMGNA